MKKVESGKYWIGNKCRTGNSNRQQVAEDQGTASCSKRWAVCRQWKNLRQESIGLATKVEQAIETGNSTRWTRIRVRQVVQKGELYLGNERSWGRKVLNRQQKEQAIIKCNSIRWRRIRIWQVVQKGEQYIGNERSWSRKVLDRQQKMNRQ